MSEQNHQEQQQNQEQHHHHHHHHHSGHHHHHSYEDWAAMFKDKSLKAIENKKKLEKWLFYFLCGVAVIMFIAVIVVYKIS